MFKKVFITALLCLASSQSQANDAAFYDAVKKLLIDPRLLFGTTFIPGTVEICFHKVGTAIPTTDGKEYHTVYGHYYYLYNSYPYSIKPYFFAGLLVKNGETYSRVDYYLNTQSNVFLPFLHPVTQQPVSIRCVFPRMWEDTPNCRYFYTFEDYEDLVLACTAPVPRTLDEFNARYGFNYSPATYGFDLTFPWAISPNPLYGTDVSTTTLYKDTDGGGVPDWFEVVGGHWPGSNPKSKDDDIFCVCNPCCRCQCKCQHWSQQQCDGSTDPTTGCTCHDGSTPPDPENPDPESSDNPGLSPNALPLLRALLFFVCFCCGAGFFGVFIDSFEKGSF